MNWQFWEMSLLSWGGVAATSRKRCEAPCWSGRGGAGQAI